MSEEIRKLRNVNLKEFVAQFLWFLDVADGCDKLGLIRMLLANINCNHVTNLKTQETLGTMLDDIQKMIEEDTTHQENLSYTYIKLRSVCTQITKCSKSQVVPPKDENSPSLSFPEKNN